MEEEQNNEETELRLNPPQGSIVREAEEVVNRAVGSNHVTLIDKLIGWQGKVSRPNGSIAVYGADITYALAPKKPMYDVDILNKFMGGFVSKRLEDNKIQNESSWRETFYVSEGDGGRYNVHFGSLHFKEDAGRITTETTTQTRIMLDPALEIVVDSETDFCDPIEKETESQIDMIHNRVHFEFYPNEELAKKAMQPNTYGRIEEPWRRAQTPFEEFRRNKLFEGSYKEGDIVKLDFDTLKESVKQSGAILQSAEEVAAFRVMSDIGKKYDSAQGTRTIALYFKERGKWHVAFDDSSNPSENPIYAMHDKWEQDKYLHHYSSRIVAPRKDVLVKGIIGRAKSSGRVVCIEGLDLSLQNNPITQAALNHWAEPYEVYLSGLSKELYCLPKIEVLPEKKYLERRVGNENADLRMVCLEGITHYDGKSSSNGSILLGGNGGGELKGFTRLPEGMK